jgi:uncharacterized phage protein gp47/JayE
MPDLTDQLHVTAETPESIKARLLADTNAGIDPNDPAYADTVPGSIWDDFNGALTLEVDRVYDRFNEVVAAAIPASTSGIFADAWALSLGLERKAATPAAGVVTFTGPNGTAIAPGTQVATVTTALDTDPATYAVDVGGTISGTSIDLAVTAVDQGSPGNVPANTVTVLDTPITGVTVTNADAMTGGSDVETDEALVVRLVRKLSGAGGAGNLDDYINWGLNWPGVGFVTAQPNTPSLGHVTVVITDVNNDPAPTSMVNALQAFLDPSASPAQGEGEAPVGATVHVSTPTSFAVAVVSDVTLDPGYTFDGDSGSIAVRAAIEESVGRYINRLPAGGDVIHNKALAAIIDVVGVADVVTLTLNGSGTNVAVSGTQVAAMTTPITLS